VDVDGAGVAVEFAAPDAVEEVVAGEDDARVGGEGGEEVEFLGRQVHGAPALEDGPGSEPDLHIAKAGDLVGRFSFQPCLALGEL